MKDVKALLLQLVFVSAVIIGLYGGSAIAWACDCTATGEVPNPMNTCVNYEPDVNCGSGFGSAAACNAYCRGY